MIRPLTATDNLALAQAIRELQTEVNNARSVAAKVSHDVSVGNVYGLGSGMNDTYTASDNVDGTHALNIRYVIASNTQRINSARLSFHLGPYRTYSNFTATGTSTESATHTHGQGTSGAGSSHVHSQHIVANAGQANARLDAFTSQLWDTTTGGGNYDIPNINAEAAHTHSQGTGNSENSTHTHTVSGSTFSGVVEGATATGLTIAFDGVDQTAALGGPWSVDVVEMDLRAFIATTPGTYHTISLLPTALGRIEAHLRLGAYVDARLP